MKHLRARILFLFTMISVLTLSLPAQGQQVFAPRIPIKIPAGARGMQPDLALVYTPNNGNGLLGMGWSLTGLSAITRINYGKGIHFRGGDTYAHSDVGVLIQQADGSYRSKKESFTKFVTSGTCGDGPCGWTATDRSGTRYFYGTDLAPSSRLWVQDQAGVKVWALSGVQDLFGNYYKIDYDGVFLYGQLYPNIITYTMGPGLNTYRTVEFSYEDRSSPDAFGDVERVYYSSRAYPQIMDRRLKTITIKSDGTPLRKYVLDYQYGITHGTVGFGGVGFFGGASGRSQLISVQELAPSGDNWVALPAQTFSWQQGGQRFLPVQWGTNQGTWFIPRFGYSKLLTGDFDGDGMTDVALVLCREVITPGQRHLYINVHLARNPTAPSEQWAPQGYGPQRCLGDNYSTFLTGDFDGDGRTDIAYIHADGNLLSIDVYRYNQFLGGGFVKENWFSGDHWYTSSPYTSSLVATDWQRWGIFLIGDFDGDGKSDIAYRHGIQPVVPPYNLIDSTRIYRSNGSAFISTYGTGVRSDRDEWDLNWQYQTFLTGDFDGDGRTDIMHLSSVNGSLQSGPIRFRASLSRGTVDNTTTQLVNEDWGPANNVMWQDCWGCGTFLTGDFNGDGKTDIAYLWGITNAFNNPPRNSIAMDVIVSTGKGHSSTRWLDDRRIGDGDWLSHGTFLKGDFNGDGKTDIAYAWSDADNPGINIDVYQSTGLECGNCGFAQPMRWATNQGSWIGGTYWREAAAFLTGDFNGDGKTDVLYAWDSNGQVRYDLHTNDPIAPDFMTTVNNGLGGSQTVTYIAAPRVPGAVAVESMPTGYVANKSPQQLVTKVITSDGGGSYETAYAYADAKFWPGPIPTQRNLGFREITATDVQTGQSTTTHYRQEPGYEGRPLDVYVRAGSGQLMRHTHYNYQIVYPATGTELVERTSQTDETYELGSLAYSRITSYGYDNYGNIEFFGISADGVDNDFSVYTTYDNDTTRWILGRIREVQTVSEESLLKDIKAVWTSDNITGIQELLAASSSWVETSMTYDSNGMLRTVTEPPTEDKLDRTTTITYDDAFHAYPKTVTHALGHSTHWTYTADGLVATVTDHNNHTTTILYDVFGRRYQDLRPDGGMTTYTYWNFGDPNNQRVQVEDKVDASRSIVSSTYFDGTGFTYHAERTGDSGQTICVNSQKDNAGRPYRVSIPRYCADDHADSWTTVTYDTAGRLSTITTPDDTVTRYGYGADHTNFGRYVSVTDANNKVTTQYYNAVENIKSIVDAANQTTFYAYDPLGRLTSVTLPDGGTTSIGYDSLDRKVWINEPQLGITTSVYYDNGNLKTVYSGGRAVNYKYDAVNRVTRKEPDEGAAITYEYDQSAYANGIGRLTTLVDNAGTTHYGYSSLGRLESVKKVMDGSDFSETFVYDLGGRVVTIKYPDSSPVDYVYTDGGNLSTVALLGQIEATWSDYDAVGAPGRVAYRNGVSTTYTYDIMNHLRHLLTTNQSTTFQDLAFDWYTPSFNGSTTNGLVLGRIWDNRANTYINGTNTDETQQYSYDSLYRLQSAAGVWGTRSYVYDSGGIGIGNPTTFGGYTQRTLTFSGGPTSHQVTSGTDGANWNISNVVYDSLGNMVFKRMNDESWQYNWTSENRLLGARKNGVVIGSMIYDAHGQRVKKKYTPSNGPAVTTTYIDKIYEKRTYSDGSPERHTLHVFGNGAHVMSWTRSGTIERRLFYHRNLVNSTSVVTDDGGTEVSRIVYMPFGEVAEEYSVNSHEVTDKYTGQESEEELGLYYYNARYYDPSIGRFLSADSIVPSEGDAQSFNRYSYTRNNPISRTDPTGLSDCDLGSYCPSSTTPQGLFDFQWSWGGNKNACAAGDLSCWRPQQPASTPGGGGVGSGPPTRAPGAALAPRPGDDPGDPNGLQSIQPSLEPYFRDGTLSRAQAINELAALKVRMASQRITPEAIEYMRARGTVGLLGGLDSGWGTYIADHPIKSGAMIFGGVFVIGVSGGVGYGLVAGTLEVGGGTLLTTGTVGTVVAKGQTGVFYSGWGSGITDAIVNKYMALRDLGQSLTGTALAAQMRALEAAGTKINWAMPSAQFAADIGLNGGLARVVLGNVPGAQSIWILTERPILNFFRIPIEYHLRVLP